jgi:hypothetical protein
MIAPSCRQLDYWLFSATAQIAPLDTSTAAARPVSAQLKVRFLELSQRQLMALH